MNKEQFEGSWKQFKGELKKKWGQFTDNDLLEAEGDYDKFLGVVQKRYGDKKEDVEQWTTDWYSKREREEVDRDEHDAFLVGASRLLHELDALDVRLTCRHGGRPCCK